MAVVRETHLPGVGVRHDFRTEDGREVGVLVYRDGRRDVLVYDDVDPDTCSMQITFSRADTQTLSELLGASQVTEAIGAVQQQIEGLSIEWITVDERSSAVGRSIADGEYRVRSGASIVAVVRYDSSIPAPSPEFVVEAGDVVVAVGTTDGLATLRNLIDAGLTLLAAGSADAALAFIEVGAVALGLALLAHLAGRLGMTAVPLYLLAGLAFGEGGLAELDVSTGFIELTAEIGVLLLLFTLGLEYTEAELTTGLRTGMSPGLVDMMLNAMPGVALGFILGWEPLAAVLLGGVTWISSSGVVSKVLADLGRLANRETPAILNLLVIEDLAMAVYLPVVAALIVGGSAVGTVASVSIAARTVAVILLAALRYGSRLSRVLSDTSDESLLLAVFGITLLVVGGAQSVEVSGAIGAFLVGLALSGEAAERANQLIAPLRDLFVATFFVFFSFQIDPRDLLNTLGAATILAVFTAATKVVTGWYAAGVLGAGHRGRLRAGTALIARGEFSIVIAALGAELVDGAELGASAAGYVLVTAVVGPLAARFSDEIPLPSRFRSTRRAAA